LGSYPKTESGKAGPVLANKKATFYPVIKNNHSGQYMPTPTRADMAVVPLEKRAPWNNTLRGQYIASYIDSYGNPNWDWSGVDIHHVIQESTGEETVSLICIHYREPFTSNRYLHGGQATKMKIGGVSMILKKTLQALKKRLDEKGNMEIVAEQGEIHTVHCSFNPPIAGKELKDFQDEKGWILPEDVQQFLSKHNGAKMYEMLLGSINIGGGLQIYSLEEIKKTHDALKSLSDYIPIGYVFENNLLISRTALERDDPDYLYISGTLLKPEPLHSNLELFLDRFVVSQGSNFWEWPNYTAKNYYKQSGGIETSY